MIGKLALTSLALVVGLGGIAEASAPDNYLRYDGNKWRGRGNPFTRLCWLYMTDPDDPELITWQYKVPDVTMQFTAAVSAPVGAARMMLRNSDSCTANPNVTVSIQTDDGSGNPSGTVVGTAWTGTVGVWDESRSRYTTNHKIDVPLGTANLIAGQVYHLRMTVHNMVMWPGGGGGEGAEPAGGVDFRIQMSSGGIQFPRGSDPNDWDWTDHQTRSYDGFLDENMYVKYLEEFLVESPVWRVGQAGVYMPPSPGDLTEEYFKVRVPLFELFSLALPDPAEVTGYSAIAPIENMAQGYYRTNADRTFGDPNIAAAESYVAHYPYAEPVAQKIQIRARKVLGSIPDPNDPNMTIPVDPDAPLIVELQKADGTFLAQARIDPNTMSTSLDWVTAELKDADPNMDINLKASQEDGTRYQVVFKTENLTVGSYVVQGQEANSTYTPDNVNTYRGVEAYVLSSTDGGQSWGPPIMSEDLLFTLGIVIPGDATGDDLVNVADLGVVGANWKQPGDWTMGDFNGDGFINVADLGVLGAHWKEHLPEPTSVVLWAVAAGLALKRRRR